MRSEDEIKDMIDFLNNEAKRDGLTFGHLSETYWGTIWLRWALEIEPHEEYNKPKLLIIMKDEKVVDVIDMKTQDRRSALTEFMMKKGYSLRFA